jgi:hypothetical protein
MTVDTKTAPHRALRFASMADVLDEAERIEAALRDGTATHTGNWSIGEIGDHCAKFIAAACDGFGARAPAIVRLVLRAMYYKKAMGPDPMPTGFKLPKQAASLRPDDGITDAEGLDHLRKELKRVLAGKEMTHPSPIFGPLSHDQWVTIQTKHCAMHMGFITYPDADRVPQPNAGPTDAA